MNGGLAAVLAFAALVACVAAHVVLVVSLARRAAWQALVAFVVPPLAPYWGWQRGLRRRVAAWWILVVAYAITVEWAATSR